MTEQRTIRLEALSPLWTGGVDATSDVARAAGLAGSLRWWYEAILRAFGHRCCDPSSHDSGSPHRACDASNACCAACEAYGASGRSRGFRIEVSGGKRLDFAGSLNVRPRGKQQNRGWYLGPGITGQLVLRVVPLRREAEIASVTLPLMLAARWAALGARTQVGYGVVRIRDEFEMPGLPTSGERTQGDLPDLRDMFFAKLRFEGQGSDWWRKVAGLALLGGRCDRWVAAGSVPIAPAIKDWLRFGRNGQSPIAGVRRREHADFLFGKVQRDGRVRSRLCVSCAYQADSGSWELRVWGWLPREVPGEMNRDAVIRDLKDMLAGSDWHELLGGGVRNVRLSTWREFDSDRDAIARFTDVRAYVENLMSGSDAVVRTPGQDR